MRGRAIPRASIHEGSVDNGSLNNDLARQKCDSRRAVIEYDPAQGEVSDTGWNLGGIVDIITDSREQLDMAHSGGGHIDFGR